MKKHSLFVIIFLVLIMTLVLCACGENSTEPQTTPPAEAVQEAVEKHSEEAGLEAPSTVNARELAETMLGKSMSELIDLIGEPSMSDYAPSCLGPGEDGEHHYDGFIVYTYREGGDERVEEIYVVK